jgi:undecaprenyl-diphosphatase
MVRYLKQSEDVVGQSSHHVTLFLRRYWSLVAASLGTAISTGLLFTWLAEEVYEGDAQNFDNRVRGLFHSHASPALTIFFRDATWLGSAMVIAVLFALFCAGCLWLRRRAALVWMALAMAGALVIESTLKHAFHRPRPAAFFGMDPGSYSFPSGHSLFSFCFYGVAVWLLNNEIGSRPLRALLWISAALIVLAVGLSRIYLGVHYPTDVLGGYAAAAVWTSCLLALYEIRERKARGYLPR